MTIKLLPEQANVKLGQSVTIKAIHSSSNEGVWLYDRDMVSTIQVSNQSLTIRPLAFGMFVVSFTIDNQTAKMMFTVDEEYEGEWEEENEESEQQDEELKRITINTDLPEQSLYKLPNMMFRNARYRGQRESEKVLNSHQEQIYDIHKLHQDIYKLKQATQDMTNSWFYNEYTHRNFKKMEETKVNSSSIHEDLSQSRSNEKRAFSDDVVQLKQVENALQNKMVGIFYLQDQLKMLDERMAELERRYMNHENAYK